VSKPLFETIQEFERILHWNECHPYYEYTQATPGTAHPKGDLSWKAIPSRYGLFPNERFLRLREFRTLPEPLDIVHGTADALMYRQVLENALHRYEIHPGFEYHAFKEEGKLSLNKPLGAAIQEVWLRHVQKVPGAIPWKPNTHRRETGDYAITSLGTALYCMRERSSRS
jgi:hypothetical protein